MSLNISKLQAIRIISISCVVIGALFIVNIFTGWFVKASYCRAFVEPCTFWRSYLYLSSQAHNTDKLNDDTLAQIFLREKERFLKDQENNVYTKKLAEQFKNVLNNKEKITEVMNAFAAQEKIKEFRALSSITEEQTGLVSLYAYSTIATTFQKYLDASKNSLVEKNIKILGKIMPTTVNLNDYVRFFDRLQENINTPQKPFVFENISVKEGTVATEYFDTVDISFLLRSTNDNLKEFLKAVYDSGNLPVLSPENNPLFPFLEVNQIKTTLPKDDIATASGAVLLSEMKLTAYIKAVSESSVTSIQQEIKELEDKITTADKIADFTEDKRIKKESLVQYIDSYKTEATNALANKNFRKALSALQNIKELTSELYTLYL